MKIDYKVALVLAAVAVVAIAAAAILLSGGSGDRDVVVGDYVNMDMASLESVTEYEDTTVQSFYHDKLAYDVSEFEPAGEAPYDYGGNYIVCDTYKSGDRTVYLAKGSQVLVYDEDAVGDIKVMYGLEYADIDITAPFTAEDLREGMRFEYDYRVTGTDWHDLRIYTIGTVIDWATTVEYEDQHFEEATASYVVASIDGDTLTMENGEKMSKEAFLDNVSYDAAMEDVRSIMEVEEVREYKKYSDHFFPGPRDYDVTELVGTKDGNPVKAIIYHLGEYVVYGEDWLYIDDTHCYCNSVEITGTSLGKYRSKP